MTYFFLKNFVLGPILRLLFRPWSRGTEHIPKVVVQFWPQTSLSFVDIDFSAAQGTASVTFLAKSEYFNGKGIKGALISGFYFHGPDSIDRSGGKASEDSLNTGLGVLERGLLLGIYPEGTRSPNSEMHRAGQA